MFKRIEVCQNSNLDYRLHNFYEVYRYITNQSGLTFNEGFKIMFLIWKLPYMKALGYRKYTLSHTKTVWNCQNMAVLCFLIYIGNCLLLFPVTKMIN